MTEKRPLSRWFRESVTAVQQWDPDELLPELHKKRFQRLECLEAYLSRVEETANTSPKLALKLARRGPDYARRVGGEEFEARAWALKGSVERILGDLPAANKSFQEALKVLDGRECPELAGVKWQLACLRSYEGRLQEGLELANEAISYFRENRNNPRVDSCDRLCLAAALNRKAILIWKTGKPPAESAKIFLEALRETNDHTVRTAAVVAKNFSVLSAMAWMSGEGGFRADEVLRMIKRTRENLTHLGYDRHTLWGARLQWVEGNGLAHLANGLSRAAEHHLRTAQTSLANLGAMKEVVEVSLDIGYWLLSEGRWEKLQELARATLEVAVSANYAAEQYGILKEWLLAIEKKMLDDEVFKAVYREIRGVPSPQLPAADTEDDSSPTGW